MKNKYALEACLTLPFLILISAMIFFKTSTTADQVWICMRGYDPRDLIAGHYLSLQPDWNCTDCGQFQDQDCTQIAQNFHNAYRYYIPEKQADTLDRLSRNTTDIRVSVAFALPKYRMPIMIGDSLRINDTPWREWLRQQDAVPHDANQTSDRP